MTSSTEARAYPDLPAAWQRFQAQHARAIGEWVEAERALALAAREGAPLGGATGDRLLSAEATLQRHIVDFAASEVGSGDSTALALGLLRLAERELFENPPDLRTQPGDGDRRRGDRPAPTV
jgi:hypothetical protein